MVTFKSLSMRLMTSHCKFVKILIYSTTLHWTVNIHIHSSFVVCLFFPELGKIPLPLHWSLLFSFLKALITILFSMRWFLCLLEHLNYSFFLLPEQCIFSTTLYSDMYVFILLDHESNKWLFFIFESSICTVDIQERIFDELIHAILHLHIVSTY